MECLKQEVATKMVVRKGHVTYQDTNAVLLVHCIEVYG
jgi:hypothetical protein